MSRLEDLISRVSDQRLKHELEDALAELKKRRKFGIVFEEHIPETTSIFGLPIQPGLTVERRNDSEATALYRILSIENDDFAVIEQIENGSNEKMTVPVSDLLVVKRFGDSMYPTLTPLESIQRGGSSRPYHAVINGENYHTLQLFRYMYEGKVDCIYIDPPYNTGARDWKYNNHYVDNNDSWRHSKWLSFMEKRLAISRHLLKSDGVLIVTIDEHEIHHLGMLLERIFPDYLRYMITIVNNPKGTGKRNFSRMDEQAFFIVPDTGKDVIKEGPRSHQVTINFCEEEEVDALDEEYDDESELEDDELVTEITEEEEAEDEWEYQHARRRGNESSYRHQRHNQFYPIYIDEEKKIVVRAGDSIPLGEKPDFSYIDGLRPIWPIDKQGLDRCWRFIPSSMQKEIEANNVYLGSYNKKLDTWTINIKRRKKVTKKLKTIWWQKSYDAGTHGTELLKKILGKPGLFPFPKSVYAVKDCLAAVTRDRPDALILDFFAGSGTTLHATCLLNAEDGGQRRCILVTNNEVSDKTANKLNKKGYYRGDPVFEAEGIFEKVTRPRCKAITNGIREDGTHILGSHVGGRKFKDGFAENVEFFHLDYLDPDEVDLGQQFFAISPILWLSAGGFGSRESNIETDENGFIMPLNSTYAVLFRESRFRQFQEALKNRPEISHIWLVTDSEEAYTEMRSELPNNIHISMLYRDYLKNFKINNEGYI